MVTLNLDSVRASSAEGKQIILDLGDDEYQNKKKITDSDNNQFFTKYYDPGVKKNFEATDITSIFADSAIVNMLDLTNNIVKDTILRYPTFITIDPMDNLYVIDLPRVRKITPGGVVSILAGNGEVLPWQVCGTDGVGIAASFEGLIGILSDFKGNIYVKNIWDYYNIRKISTVGFSIMPNLPSGLTMDKTGVISGTPLKESPKTTYTLTNYTINGSFSTNFTIEILAEKAGRRLLKQINNSSFEQIHSLAILKEDTRTFYIIENPVYNKQLKLQVNKANKATVFNSLGQVIMSKILSEGLHNVYMPTLLKSTYYIKMGNTTLSFIAH